MSGRPAQKRPGRATTGAVTYGVLTALVLGGAFLIAVPSYASDVTLEVLRSSVTGLLVGIAFVIGTREQLHRERGWWLIVAGLFLLFLGSVIDITDNYEALGKYRFIGDTTEQAFIEKYVGFLGGFVLLLLGAANWLPLVGRTRRARDELSRRNDLVLAAAGEGIYGLDLQGNTTFVNPAAARMIGWEVDALIGLPQHSVLHHSRADGTAYPREQCPIYAAFTDGEIHQIDDEVFWRKDGSSFSVEYVSTPIREDGELVGAVVTFRDITERERLQDARIEAATANARADELAHARERIVAAQESVRREVAQRLHGSIQNSLILLINRLRDLQQRAPEAIADELEAAHTDLETLVTGDLRTISHQLYPSILRRRTLPRLQ